MSRPHALAIDTTSDVLSLAVLRDGRPAGSLYAPRGTAIARTILPEIESLLAGARLAREALDALFVACGPGSFTGTRIGMSVALTLGRVLGRPVIGVDTLSILAAQVDPAVSGPFHVVLNCARDEAYHAGFQRRGEHVEMLGEIRLTTLLLAAADIGRAPCVVRRFEPEPGPSEGWVAGLVRAPLAHPHPDALRLLAVGLPRYLAGPAGPFPVPTPLYLKSEAFRTWQPHRVPAGLAGAMP